MNLLRWCPSYFEIVGDGVSKTYKVYKIKIIVPLPPLHQILAEPLFLVQSKKSDVAKTSNKFFKINRILPHTVLFFKIAQTGYQDSRFNIGNHKPFIGKK